MLKADYLDLTM